MTADRPSYREPTFSPLQAKSLQSVLLRLFVNEFGYENRVIFAKAMIQHILETLDTFTKPRSLLKPGQLLWMAVANDGKKHAQQPMEEIPKVPVVLDLITQEDVQRLVDGEEFYDIRRHRHARLLEQAFEQGGVLSQTDLACMTMVSPGRIAFDIDYFQKEEHRLLPYRGTVQDVGRTTTHKVEAIRLFEEGYLEPDICKMLSPTHTLASVERYIQSYKNMLKLLRRKFSPLEISGILSMAKTVVVAYVEIACEHHPDLVKQNPYLPLEENDDS